MVLLWSAGWRTSARLTGSPELFIQMTLSNSKTMTPATIAPTGAYRVKPSRDRGDIDVEHHHDEQEQHHDGADVDEHQDDRQEFGLEQQPQDGARDERQDEEQRRVDRVARR